MSSGRNSRHTRLGTPGAAFGNVSNTVPKMPLPSGLTTSSAPNGRASLEPTRSRLDSAIQCCSSPRVNGPFVFVRRIRSSPTTSPLHPLRAYSSAPSTFSLVIAAPPPRRSNFLPLAYSTSAWLTLRASGTWRDRGRGRGYGGLDVRAPKRLRTTTSTARLGTSQADSVVGTLKGHGATGLRVVDASVSLEPPAAHPVVLVVALAERPGEDVTEGAVKL
ncbi:unnamed protein product [Peniophora sp. CBMAI 1063]|nr:unnamed protein product [Peniophora sp. CBMAI 1063]